MNGEELEVAAVITDYASFATAVDKQFEDVAPGETLEVQTAYVLKDAAAPIKVTFEQLFGKKNGTITIDPAALSRETSADSTGSTNTALPALTGDALLDWWNGAWYGWWTMTGCSGAYESMAGQWWDACAVIDIGMDYTGTVTIWDEDYSRADPMSQATVTLNSAGVGEHGTVMSESGYFTNLPLEHADWIVDPAINSRFPDVENMICIEGWYEDGEDEFYYEVYLRPWGQLWDDFAADYPDDVPYYYDDWYLPLVEAGSAMPDVVGGEAVPSGSGGTDAMTQTPSSADAPAAPTAANVSGGDGIVTEEQVQKGYVWMNEVNNNIFDATYDDIVAYFGVEGQFVKEEYSDHMKANYRYYKWISEDDDSHFIYVNFKEKSPGVYVVSAYNTSGFSGTEAIEKYLDIVKAEAAEANKAASANAEMKDFSVEIAQFAKDDVKVKIMTKIPVSGWSFDDSGRCLVENDDPTAFGAGAIQFEVRENVEKFDSYKDSFKNYKRTISHGAEGAYFTVDFEGTGIILTGVQKGDTVVSIEVDGKTVNKEYAVSKISNRQSFLLINGLEQGKHTLKLTVVSGNCSVDAAQVLYDYEAVNKAVISETSSAAESTDSSDSVPEDNDKSAKSNGGKAVKAHSHLFPLS